MSGMLSRALSALFKENEDLARSARALGEAASFRLHRRSRSTDLSTGQETCTWQIEFPSPTELDAFHVALAEIVDHVTGGVGE